MVADGLTTGYFRLTAALLRPTIHYRTSRKWGMTMKQGTFTAVLEKEDGEFVALCPELDVASQGKTVEKAMANLREAVELFLECASPEEVERRLHHEVFVTRFEAVYA